MVTCKIDCLPLIHNVSLNAFWVFTICIFESVKENLLEYRALALLVPWKRQGKSTLLSCNKNTTQISILMHYLFMFVYYLISQLDNKLHEDRDHGRLLQCLAQCQVCIRLSGNVCLLVIYPVFCHYWTKLVLSLSPYSSFSLLPA